MSATDRLSTLLDRQDEFIEFLRRRVPVPADAEDVLQKALMTAARRLEDLRDEGSLVPWFYQVLRTTLIDHVRAHRRWTRAPHHGFEASATMPAHEVGNCSCSLVLLAELPSAYVDILTRIDVLEEPLATVAAELGVTPNNAKVRLHRARKALRERLEACCGCKSAQECQRCGCATGCAV